MTFTVRKLLIFFALLMYAPVAVNAAQGDIDMDGTTDVFVRTGLDTYYTCLPIPAVQFSCAYFLGRTVLPEWRMVGYGRYGPMETGIIFHRQNGAGDVVVHGAVGLASNPSIGLADPVIWRAIGAGDFDGDGFDDLLWQNVVTGDVLIWFMASGMVREGVLIYSGVSTDWEVRGTGNFDANLTSDIVWYNKVTGDVQIWMMFGVGTFTSQYVGRGDKAAGWRIVGVGDFDGDGFADLAWQNDDGDINVWFLRSGELADGVKIAQAVSPEWSVIGTGQLDANATSDIYWFDNLNGDLVAWRMFGTAFTGVTLYSPLNPIPFATAAPAMWQGEGN